MEQLLAATILMAFTTDGVFLGTGRYLHRWRPGSTHADPPTDLSFPFCASFHHESRKLPSVDPTLC
jgi:hypothetical protein